MNPEPEIPEDQTPAEPTIPPISDAPKPKIPIGTKPKGPVTTRVPPDEPSADLIDEFELPLNELTHDQ